MVSDMLGSRNDILISWLEVIRQSVWLDSWYNQCTTPNPNYNPASSVEYFHPDVEQAEWLCCMVSAVGV